MAVEMDAVSFTVNVVGNVTGIQWHGVFKTRVRLSHRDWMRQDQVRRELLGPNPAGAGARATDSADLFSTILTHVIDSPTWWKDNENGLGLEDDNVVVEVFNGVMKAKVDAAEEVRKRAEAAKTELAGK